MKPTFNPFLRSVFAALTTVVFTIPANAETYYWDADDVNPGFGTASGTWDADAFWSKDSTGSSVAANATTTAVDDVYFGTDAVGLLAGTISGPANAEGFLNMTFGSASGAIVLSTGALDLDATTGSTITVNNASDSISTVLQGTGGKLIKAGPGTLVLSGANTYTDSTTISAGKLSLASNLIASSSAINIADGATLETTGGVFALAPNQSITGTGSTGFATTSGLDKGVSMTGTNTISTSGTLIFTRLNATGTTSNQITGGNIESGGTGTSQRGLVIGSGASGTLTITGGSVLTKGTTANSSFDVVGNGPGATGTLIISGGSYTNQAASKLMLGNSTGSGVFTLNSGSATISEIEFNTTASATVNLNGGSLTLSKITSVLGTRTFNFDGGQFIAGAALPAFTGVTMNVKNGGAKIDTNGFSFGIGVPLVRFTGATTDGLIKSGSGTLTLYGANTFGGKTLITAGQIAMGNVLALQNSAYDTTDSNGTTIGLDVTGGLSTGTLTLGGLAGSVDIASAITAGYGSVTNLTLNPQTGSSVTYTGSLANGSMSLTKTGAGTQILTGANSYSGATAVNAGVLAIGGKDALNGTSGISVANTATLRIDAPDATSTTIGSGKSVSIVGNGASNFGALQGAASTNVTWAGNVVIVGNTISRISGGDSGTLTVDGVISGPDGSSAGILFSRAPGSTTILSKVNTYTGETQLYPNGSTVTLKMGIANAINSGSRVLIGSSTTGTAYFDLNGYNQNIRTIADGVTGDLVVTNSSLVNDAELKLSVTDAQSFNGWIQDGAVRKTSLVVAGGTSGAQILFGANTFTGGTRIDSGTLFLSHATNTLADTGVVNVNGGALSLGNSGANSDTVGALTLTNGSITGTTGTLTGTGSNYDVRSGTVSAKLGGSIGLDKTTAGTVTLTNANSYSGNTTVSEGTLKLGNVSTNSSLDDASTVTIAAGAKIELDFPTGPLTSDSVKKLYLGTPAVQVPAGVYDATHSIYGSYFAGTGSLTVTDGPSAGGYTSWAASKTGFTDTAAGHDPDHDGIKNLLEYALNGDPMASDMLILPTLSIVGTHFIFSFTRRLDSASDTTQIFESSTDLNDWTTRPPLTIPAAAGTYSEVIVGPATGSPPNEVQSITITIPKDSNTKLFGRLNVSQ